jgi:hypothetical protein
MAAVNCLSSIPDGGTRRRIFLLWWKCGRYLELLVIEGVTLR